MASPSNCPQFDFRGLLRKTNTHIADDVHPTKIPVLVPLLAAAGEAAAGAVRALTLRGSRACSA
jgi:hypothetical protein